MVRGLEKAFQAEDTGYGDIMIYRDVLTKLPMPELHYCHRALGSTTSARTLDNKTQRSEFNSRMYRNCSGMLHCLDWVFWYSKRCWPLYIWFSSQDKSPLHWASLILALSWSSSSLIQTHNCHSHPQGTWSAFCSKKSVLPLTKQWEKKLLRGLFACSEFFFQRQLTRLVTTHSTIFKLPDQICEMGH